MNELEQNFLAHHGILGQKWGRKQGPPYPLDADEHSAYERKEGYKKSIGGGRNEKLYDRHDSERHESKSSDTPKKSETKQAVQNKSSKPEKAAKQAKSGGHRDTLIERYKRQGLTQEEAEAAADKRIKTEKAVAIGIGAAALTAAAVVAYKKIGSEYFDQVIKPGTSLQTLTADKNRIGMGQEYYAALTKGDKKNYIGRFGIDQKTGNKLKIQTQVKDGAIKIASRDKAKKAFGELYKNDKDFASYVEKYYNELPSKNRNKLTTIIKKSSGGGALTGKEQGTLYDVYNRLLVDHSEEGEANKKKFYKILKDAGYSGIVDMNDKKYSGFRSKNPLIIFDAGKMKVDQISKLSTKEIQKAANSVAAKEILRNQLIMNSPYIGVGGIVAGSMASSSYDNKLVQETKKKRTANG